MKQNPITRSAKGQACTLKLDQCVKNNETTVFCHLNGGGMGAKSTDDLGRDIGFYGCQYCHDVYDGRITHPWYKPSFVDEMVDFAVIQTNKRLKKMGLK